MQVSRIMINENAFQHRYIGRLSVVDLENLVIHSRRAIQLKAADALLLQSESDRNIEGGLAPPFRNSLEKLENAAEAIQGAGLDLGKERTRIVFSEDESSGCGSANSWSIRLAANPSNSDSLSSRRE
jgi:hypothetical protein